MSEINNWSVAAGNNNAAPPDGWPENTMTFGQINNTARETMAVLARWFIDTSGILLATGLNYHAPANAWGYQLTCNRAVTLDLNFRVRFRIPTTNVGPTWLTINGIGPNWIKWPDGTDCQANDLADVVDVYWHGSGAWILDNLQRRRIGEFNSGTAIVFYATTAPTGWAQLTGWNDRLLRVVNGAGTGVGGTWVISGISIETANHTHAYTGSGTSGSTSIGSSGGYDFGGAASAAAPGSHSHSIAWSGSTTGVSNDHTHTQNGAWRPAYGDVIICQKV